MEPSVLVNDCAFCAFERLRSDYLTVLGYRARTILWMTVLDFSISHHRREGRRLEFPLLDAIQSGLEQFGRLLKALASKTLPLASTTPRKVTVPSMFFFKASSGYATVGDLISFNSAVCSSALSCFCGGVPSCAGSADKLVAASSATTKSGNRRKDFTSPPKT